MQFYFSEPEVDYQNEADNQNEAYDITYEEGEGRTTINIQPPQRLNDYIRFSDSIMNDDGELVKVGSLCLLKLNQ